MSCKKGGVNGSLSAVGREIRAGGKLKIAGVAELDGMEFSIKSVSHSLNGRGYSVSVEFEG